MGLAAAALPKPSAARSEVKRPATGVDGSVAGLEAAADSQPEVAGTAAILLLSLAASSSAARSTVAMAAWQHVSVWAGPLMPLLSRAPASWTFSILPAPRAGMRRRQLQASADSVQQVASAALAPLSIADWADTLRLGSPARSYGADSLKTLRHQAAGRKPTAGGGDGVGAEGAGAAGLALQGAREAAAVLGGDQRRVIHRPPRPALPQVRLRVVWQHILRRTESPTIVEGGMLLLRTMQDIQYEQCPVNSWNAC